MNICLTEYILCNLNSLFLSSYSISPISSSTLSFWLQLQRLKRSLSFKTKSIRSKSADNFFRSSNDNKTELLSDVSGSTSHLCNIGMAPPHTASLPIPPVPPAIPCAPPPTSRSQSRNPLQVDSTGHCFMEHIFKKPTFCDVCNHMIVGRDKNPPLFMGVTPTRPKQTERWTAKKVSQKISVFKCNQPCCHSNTSVSGVTRTAKQKGLVVTTALVRGLPALLSCCCNDLFSFSRLSLC